MFKIEERDKETTGGPIIETIESAGCYGACQSAPLADCGCCRDCGKCPSRHHERRA